MGALLRAILTAYAAGSLGGVINSLTIWAFGMYGVTAVMGVKLAPALTAPWLYQRLVWGGIWGLLLIFPFLVSQPFLRGLIISIGPTLVQLFYVFPYMAGKGFAGMQLGTFTPVVVILVNAVWGITAALLYWLTVDRGERAPRV